MTYGKLVEMMEDHGNNLAEVAIGRMMTIIEEQTGHFPDWDEEAADWVKNQCGF
jgi:hypothetical protein